MLLTSVGADRDAADLWFELAGLLEARRRHGCCARGLPERGGLDRAAGAYGDPDDP